MTARSKSETVGTRERSAVKRKFQEEGAKIGRKNWKIEPKPLEIRRRSDLGRFGAIKVVQGTAADPPKSAQERSETRPGRPKSATEHPKSGPRRPESLQNDARTALQPLRCTVRTAFRRESSSQARSQRFFRAPGAAQTTVFIVSPP